MPGEGSTFLFTARLGRAETVAIEPTPVLELGPTTALVVDDNHTNRLILSRMLQAWGIASVAVAGGRDGLDELKQASSAGRPYGIVLTDYQMPGMSGLDLAETVKSDPSLRGTAIILLSSADDGGVRKRSRSLGVNACLIKPVTPSRLLDAIMDARGGDGAAARPASHLAPARAGARARILLAEDNRVNQLVAVKMLEKLGHTVTVVDNGRAALAAIEEGSYDMVLMDVQMPEMDGPTATRLLRESEKTTGRHLTVVAMTAHAMAGDRERFLESGMDDYISKPVSITELAAVVEKWAVRPATPDFDPADLLARIDGDRVLFDELVATFLDDTRLRIEAIRVAFEANDREALRRAAHAVKGAAASVGARRVFASASGLETASASPGNGVSDLCARLACDFERLQGQLAGAQG